MRLRAPSIALVPLVFAAVLASQQPTTPTALLTASLSAMAGAMTKSISLSGTAQYTAGTTDEHGAFSAQCAVDGSSQLQLQIPLFSRTELRSMSNGTSAGTWIDDSGNSHVMAGHNVMTPPAWFCPFILISDIVSNPATDIEYVGQESRDGQSVDHFSVSAHPLDQTPVQAWMARLSRSDLYVDSATHRLIALDFDTHPDHNATIDMPVEILFTDYSESGGLWMPTKIEKYVDSTLQLTLQVELFSPSTQTATSN